MRLGSTLAIAALLICMHSFAYGTQGGDEARRLMPLGPGDSVSIQVYGQPDMSSTEYVADDGTINLPLVGHVPVSGLSPVDAGTKVEKALSKGQFLVDPHVSITIVQSRSQRVVVLGEVKTPGRYAVDPNSSIMDLLAQAGGLTDKAADTGASRGAILYLRRGHDAQHVSTRARDDRDSGDCPRGRHYGAR